MQDKKEIQNGAILDKSPKKVKDLFVEDKILKQLNYDNSQPLDEFGKTIIFGNKMRDLDSEKYKRNKLSRMKKK